MPLQLYQSAFASVFLHVFEHDDGATKLVDSMCPTCALNVTCTELGCGLADGFTGVKGVSEGSVLGGSSVTISGFGFQPQETYICRFLSASGNFVNSKGWQFVSDQELVFDVVPWLYASQTVSLRIYVPGGCKYMHGGTYCRWVQNRFLEHASWDGGPAAKFDSDPVKFYFFSQLLSISPSYADRLGGREITLRGAGFHSGHYLCQLVNESTINLAEVTVKQNRSVLFTLALDKERIICRPPVFDSSTKYDKYENETAVLRLFERTGPGQPWRQVFSNGTLQVAVVQINRPPHFVGSQLRFCGSIRVGNVIVPNFADDIFAGADAAGNEVVSEESQLLTFSVVVVSGHQIFTATPFLHSNGTAVFPMTANSYGIVELEISLKDNGKRELGGKDVSTQTFAVDIRRESTCSNAFRQTPATGSGKSVDVIEVFESAETVVKHILPQYKSASMSLPFSTSNLMAKSTFNVTVPSLSAGYFDRLPSVHPDGTLDFILKPGAFGVATIEVDIESIHLLTSDVQVTHELINISIIAVNSVPVFEMDIPSLVVKKEDECSMSSGCEVPGVAANISASRFTALGPRGEDWPEEQQRPGLRFEIIDSQTYVLKQEGMTLTPHLSELFAVSPSIHPSNGSLFFTSVPDMSGNATLWFVLKDDGGVVHSGSQIQTSPINGTQTCSRAKKRAMQARMRAVVLNTQFDV